MGGLLVLSAADQRLCEEIGSDKLQRNCRSYRALASGWGCGAGGRCCRTRLPLSLFLCICARLLRRWPSADAMPSTKGTAEG